MDQANMLRILEVWDKRCFLELKRGSGVFDVKIEKFLLCQDTAAHLELPPLNNSM
jgi:hypothetical protein